MQIQSKGTIDASDNRCLGNNNNVSNKVQKRQGLNHKTAQFTNTLPSPSTQNQTLLRQENVRKCGCFFKHC
jgi:hypothetical protein